MADTLHAAELYYDGQCPLCSIEMRHLQQHKRDSLTLTDIHQAADLNQETKRDYLNRLHLRKPDGEMLSGLDASVYAWQQTRFGFLWSWLRWPLIKPVADIIYEKWAKSRFDRLYS